MSDFLTRALVAYAQNNDDLWWRHTDGKLTLFANIPDTFFWGYADLEEFGPENIDLLEQCAAQLMAAQGSTDSLSDYFAARLREMRPQGAAYPVRYDRRIWGLFNDCGPEREPDNGNPSAIPAFDEDTDATAAALAATWTLGQAHVDVQLRDELLDLFAFDYTDDLRWRLIEGELKFYVEDSHFGEQLHEVGIEDVPRLQQAKQDMKEAGQDYFFVDLFVARHRMATMKEGHAFDNEPYALISTALAARS